MISQVYWALQGIQSKIRAIFVLDILCIKNRRGKQRGRDDRVLGYPAANDIFSKTDLLYYLVLEFREDWSAFRLF